MQSGRYFQAREWMALLVFAVLGVVSSLGVSMYVHHLELKKNTYIFQQLSDQGVRQLEHVLQMSESILSNLQNTKQHNGEVREHEFKRYLHDVNLLNQESGILGAGFIRRVARGNVDAYLVERRKHIPLFRLQTLSSHNEPYFIVEHSEPQALNADWLGFDIASDPRRRLAAITAMRSGFPVLSASYALNAQTQEKGALLLMPSYRSDLPLASEAQRNQALEGWFFVSLAMNRVLAAVEQHFAEEFYMALSWQQLGVANYDAEPLLLSTQQSSYATSSLTHPSQFQQEKTIKVGTQTFTIKLQSTPLFEEKYRNYYDLAFFLSGMAMTILLCWALWLIGRTRNQAIRMANQLSADARDRESQINAVLNNTVESIITVDQQGMIRSFNRAAQLLFGYMEEEVLGRNIGLLHMAGHECVDETLIREMMSQGRQSRGASIFEVKACDRFGRVFSAEVSLGELTLQGETMFVGLLRDVSWKKQQESEKEAIQERLRLALEAGGFGVWQWWPDVRRFEWDANTHHLYGVEVDNFPGTYESWASLVHEDDLERVIMLMRSAFYLEDGHVSDVMRVRRPDGMICYHSVHVKVIHDADGRASAIGLTQDITAQKMIEESLRISEERFALAARAAQEGIWDWDLNTGQIWFSPQWKAHFGYRDDELDNSLAMWESLILPEDREDGLVLVRKFNRSEIDAFNTVQRFRHKDGHIVYIRSRAVQLLNKQGQVARIVGSHEDITELLRQENDLRESRERLALTIDCAGLGTWDWDVSTNKIVYGGRWLDLTGYHVDELSTQAITWRDLIHPDDLPCINAAFEAHQSGAAQYFSCECRLKTKTGSWRWVLSVGQVVEYIDQHQPARILGVNIDIHERKINEAALHEARQIAEEANRAKSEFLANISHEIRTPLNAVLGFSSLLSETDLNLRQSDFVDSIHNAGDALLVLINDLLDFSKIEAGRLELESIDFDVRTTLEETLDIVAARAAAKGLELACLIEPNVPACLKGDPARLRQIVLNLLNNAVKFTENGEVVARARAHIEKDGQVCLRVEVKDTGIGISAEEQIKLFRPFAQADASVTRRFGGTGLGLSICRRLVEAMAGQISVQSKSGKGALFWFEVRLAQADIRSEAPLLPAALQDKTALLVADHPTHSEVLSLQLQSLGFQVVAADSAQAALQWLGEGESECAIAIVDVDLAEMGEAGFVQRVRALPKCAQLPLIKVSSLADSVQTANHEPAEFASWLTKPIRRSRLLMSVQEALGITVPEEAGSDLPASAVVWQGIGVPRILLAEDNPVNQKVAVLMLEGLGCRVDVANNGAEAVAALEQKEYDLVLMDCQMPVLDGYSATRKIRSLPTVRATIPVVALTANVLKEDTERCFNVGMNDVVSKPFTRQSLYKSLSRWLMGLVAGGETVIQKKSPSVNEADNLDQAMSLDAELENIRLSFIDMEKNIGMDLRDELLELYFVTQAECCAGMQESIALADYETASMLAHKLKGAAAQLGAKELAKLCFAIERAGRMSDPLQLIDVWPKLKKLADDLKQALHLSA